MRILRLALRHYRGLEACEVHFAPRGVTIVQGPNEVGKSSLAEALELLFEERDSTVKQRVREVQPVDRDEGAEIEADVECGAYAFTYRKRFHRRPATQLELRSPRVETLTGREAHERVRALLDETVDVALWRALRLHQGEPLAQPELGSAPTLAAALDRAVGTSSGGEREETLFERAREAFARHYTPTGRPGRDLGAAEHEAARALEAEEALRARLDALERDALGERALREEVAELEQRVERRGAELRGLERELETLHTLREQVARLEARRDAARAEEREAILGAAQRRRLVDAHAAALAQRERLVTALEGEEPTRRSAAEELRRAEAALEVAREARAAAEERVASARREAARLRDERALADLRERSARAEREARDAARARLVLDGPALDPARVRKIHDAQVAVERCRARLAAEGPTLSIVPERDLELEIDGERVVLPAGEPARRQIAETLVLSLPGVGDLTLVAGAGVAERRKALEQAETRLRGLCAEAGVDDHAGAIAALEARRAAERELAESERRRAEALGGETPAALAERIAGLAERVARAEETRETRSCADEGAAEAALEKAERDASLARADAQDVARRAEAQRQRALRCEAARRETRAKLDQAERSVRDLAAQLSDARAEGDDEALAARRDARADAARALEAQTRDAAARLAERAPQETEARADAARDALERSERARRERRDALLRLGERLEVQGQEGLFEQWSAARTRRERAERDVAALRRRAAAARRLFETLRDEREAARRSYAAPLAERIAELGRPLYGPGFGVELSDDLAVERRVAAGRNLALHQLSAGAREQLALLARLAAAHVAGHVPLLLDDALGHTDPERLAALGPVLERAGELGQVIVLTCTPERFGHVEGARRVELR